MEEPILWRRNREPFLTVRAEIAGRASRRPTSPPPRCRAGRGQGGASHGHAHRNGRGFGGIGKANASLFALFPVMIAVMLLILMVQLRHFGRTALVVATAPLGIPGAAGALLLTGMPFGFVALLGVIALAGMVMRNTLILVDQVRQDTEAGWSCGRRSSKARCAARARGTDGSRRDPRLRPAHLLGVLGADGGGDDRRAGGGDGRDAAGRASAARLGAPPPAASGPVGRAPRRLAQIGCGRRADDVAAPPWRKVRSRTPTARGNRLSNQHRREQPITG